MLSDKTKKMALKEGAIYCTKCDSEMREILLPRYEYEEGLPLHNVPAFRCSPCGKLFFTRSQAREMEERSRELQQHQFGFERKITISGKSLVVSIPHELACHLHLHQGQKVKIFPCAQEGFIIRKT